MKPILIIFLNVFCATVFAQGKYNLEFEDFLAIDGTEYVIAQTGTRGKMYETVDCQILFINTKTLETRMVGFSGKGYLQNVHQVKIDALGINKIIVGGRVMKDKGSPWNSQQFVFALSPDGSEKVQITESNFFADKWTINEQTGAIVIYGFYDSNGNDKYDKTDKHGIAIYDLKTLTLLGKI